MGKSLILSSFSAHPITYKRTGQHLQSLAQSLGAAPGWASVRQWALLGTNLWASRAQAKWAMYQNPPRLGGAASGRGAERIHNTRGFWLSGTCHCRHWEEALVLEEFITQYTDRTQKKKTWLLPCTCIYDAEALCNKKQCNSASAWAMFLGSNTTATLSASGLP